MWTLKPTKISSPRALIIRSAFDAVDGSSTGIQVPHCDGYSSSVDGSFWHIAAGYGPAHERLLPGVEPPLDAGSAAMRSRAAASIASLNRPILTQSEHFAHMNSNPLDTVLDSQ